MSIGTIDKRASRRARKTELLPPEPAQVDPASQLVLDAVSHAERQHLSFATALEGPEAEHIATTSLEILGRYGWTALHEDHWPGQTEAQLVHVAVGPGGVVVVTVEHQVLQRLRDAAAREPGEPGKEVLPDQPGIQGAPDAGLGEPDGQGRPT